MKKEYKTSEARRRSALNYYYRKLEKMRQRPRIIRTQKQVITLYKEWSLRLEERLKDDNIEEWVIPLMKGLLKELNDEITEYDERTYNEHIAKKD